jgi:protoporphyrinogen oxidase
MGWLISNGTETICADRVICTMPVQHLIAALDRPPAEVVSACNSLKYNALACVNIGIRGTVPDISWLYLPDPALGKSNRISFPSSYSRNVAPAGCSAILAEITYQPDDDVAQQTDAGLVDEVIGTLEAMQLLKRDQIIFTSVERQPFAYVVYDLDYQKNIAIVRDYCAALGIPLVGRFAQFEYLNMDGCARSVMDFVSSGMHR